ncbi:MAG: AAA family ATPase, partial [Planctomycetia bacterium]|nr:AAA family ATPase [Planctomycetia bacterium]
MTRTGNVHATSGTCRALTGGFLAGPENPLVETVLHELVPTTSDAWRPSRYVPILLHGPAGSGKTTLVNGVTSAFQTIFRGERPGTQSHRTVIRTTASDLIQDFTTAARRNTVGAFRESLSAAS